LRKIILASGSPRRKAMLDLFKLKYECISAEINEEIYPHENAREAARRIARNKAEFVCKGLNTGLVISADTVVVCNGQILGKPTNYEDAYNKLKILSGKVHEVITAVCVVDAETGKYELQDETSKVYFRNISDEEIKAYIASGEPMDKAGAYAIQGMAAVFVEKIEGCYYNIVGMPVKNLYVMLNKQGVNLLGV
jgi:septum formation protein